METLSACDCIGRDSTFWNTIQYNDIRCTYWRFLGAIVPWRRSKGLSDNPFRYCRREVIGCCVQNIASEHFTNTSSTCPHSGNNVWKRVQQNTVELQFIFFHLSLKGQRSHQKRAEVLVHQYRVHPTTHNSHFIRWNGRISSHIRYISNQQEPYLNFLVKGTRCTDGELLDENVGGILMDGEILCPAGDVGFQIFFLSPSLYHQSLRFGGKRCSAERLDRLSFFFCPSVPKALSLFSLLAQLH